MATCISNKQHYNVIKDHLKPWEKPRDTLCAHRSEVSPSVVDWDT